MDLRKSPCIICMSLPRLYDFKADRVISKRAILSNAQYDFLNDMVKDVPDPVAAADKPKKPRAPRAKKEGGEAKPKAKGKKKAKSKDEAETDEDEAAVAAGMPEETPADEQMDAANDSENYDE